MTEWISSAIFGITLLLLLIGLFGLIVPIFPGLAVMWLSALGFGLVKGFSTLGIWMFVLITLLAIAGSLVDNLLTTVGSRQGGGSLVQHSDGRCGRRGGDGDVSTGRRSDPGAAVHFPDRMGQA